MVDLRKQTIESNSLNKIVNYLIDQSLKANKKVHRKGQESLEIRSVNFILTDPRDRIVSDPTRSINYSFLVGELVWNLIGNNDLESVEYYNSKMREFSDDGLTLNSAYGHRILGKHKDWPINQWEYVKQELSKDTNSKRATMNILMPSDQQNNIVGTKDYPCTQDLNWLVRDKKLDLTVNMRANDTIWGMPYDVFLFTFMQEKMALELNLDLGIYQHNANVFNVFERHYGLANDIVSSSRDFAHSSISMPKFENLEELSILYGIEYSLRKRNLDINYNFTDLVVNDFANILRYKANKIGKEDLVLQDCYKGNKIEFTGTSYKDYKEKVEDLDLTKL